MVRNTNLHKSNLHLTVLFLILLEIVCGRKCQVSVMYVPGKLVETDKVIIDVGTRYYVEKDIPAAKDYFQRKVKFVTEQMEKIQYLGLEKSKIRDAIVDIVQMKLSQQQA